MKRAAKAAGIILLILVVAVAGLLGYLTITEYRPDDREDIAISGDGLMIQTGEELSVLTYNIGYAGLSSDEDFFMDGGEKVRPESSDLVMRNLAGVSDVMAAQAADIYLLQEIDLNSKRSYNINQRDYVEEQLGMEGVFAYNFNSSYVPYPIPTIGKVESGLLTLSDRQISSAERISLPVPFSWPISTCNLKRCLLEVRLPIADSDKELVIFNLHLEAYDDGEGKIEQTNMLMELLETEYQNGNYVIAGGDFNQTFDTIEGYPIYESDNWTPGALEAAALPDGFQFAVDDTYATCRLLNGPYSGNYEESQVYVIDGYIISDNIHMEAVTVINTDFEHSDHQPVKLSFQLIP